MPPIPSSLIDHPNMCWRAHIMKFLTVQLSPVGWTIGVLGFVSRRGLDIFLFSTLSRQALGPTQPPIKRNPGVLSPWVKRQEREADYSHPSSVEVKNSWSYTSTPQYVFIAWCLVKHRDNFTITVYLRISLILVFAAVCTNPLIYELITNAVCNGAAFPATWTSCYS